MNGEEARLAFRGLVHPIFDVLLGIPVYLLNLFLFLLVTEFFVFLRVFFSLLGHQLHVYFAVSLHYFFQNHFRFNVCAFMNEALSRIGLIRQVG